MMPAFTVPWVALHGPSESSDSHLGNKARNLKAISSIPGVATPRGIAVLPSFSAEIIAPVKESIDAILDRATGPEEAFHAISECVRDPRSPGARALADWWRENSSQLFPSSGTFAVRSSGHPIVKAIQLAEDSSVTSMAGQYASSLHVPHNDVPSAYLECVASLFNPRSLLTFEVFKDRSYLASTMTVLIQEMVLGVKSGIMMTVDPLEKDSDILGIEGGCGECERYVNGSTRGDLFLISKARGDVLTYEVGAAEIACAHKISELHPCLDGYDIQRLLAAGRSVEGYFGAPQDIEFTIGSDGSITVLQTRPITTNLP